MNELQVNDVVFADSRYHGLSRGRITRVTKTRAFSGQNGFKRQYSDSGQIESYPRESDWDRNSYWKGTDILEARYEKQIVVKDLKDVKWEDHDMKTLLAVKELIGE